MSVVTLLLLLVAMGVGIFFYRRKKSKPISENTQDEEEVLEEEEEEEMDGADMIAAEKKADIAIQETKRKASVAASMAKKKKTEAAAAMAAKKKAEAEAREAKRKKDAQAALMAKKKAEAAAALAAKKKAEAEAYKRKLAKAREEKRKAEEAARRAYEAEMKRKQEAARRAYEAEMKRRRDEAARKAREAKARAYRERVRLKWNRNASTNAKKKVTACDRASWNGVKLVLNSYRKVNSDQYWFSSLRRYSPRNRDGDQNLTQRQMIPRTWRYNNVKIDVKTKRKRFGWRRVNSWGDTKTHIYFGRCWGFRGLNCSWRQKKTYDGHLFVDGNRLMLRKGIKIGTLPWQFYLKDVELAKFKGNRGECAIIAVSDSNTRKLLFVQSNNTDESYDLITGRWITHPYKKCLSLDEWTQKLCRNSSGKYMC
tara:strand:- start:2568 stop:3842 length:1275 start_codon:yes stop_codon:yes gene_type:complete